MSNNSDLFRYSLLFALIAMLIVGGSFVTAGQSNSNGDTVIRITVNDSTGSSATATTPVNIADSTEPSVPSDFPGSQSQYTAIDTNNNGIQLGELRTAVNSWGNNDRIGEDNVRVTLGELRTFVDYWQTA